MNFSVLADHGVKIKESEKSDKYLDLARELQQRLWNMKVTVIPKGLVKGLEDLEIVRQVETTQTTAFLRLARILRRVLETRGGLLSLKFQLAIIS